MKKYIYLVCFFVICSSFTLFGWFNYNRQLSKVEELSVDIGNLRQSISAMQNNINVTELSDGSMIDDYRYSRDKERIYQLVGYLRDRKEDAIASSISSSDLRSIAHFFDAKAKSFYLYETRIAVDSVDKSGSSYCYYVFLEGNWDGDTGIVLLTFDAESSGTFTNFHCYDTDANSLKRAG